MPAHSSAGGLSENRPTGLLAENLDEFRHAITTLANHRQLCREMGHAAAQYILEHHSLDQRISQIEDMLESSYLRPMLSTDRPQHMAPKEVRSHAEQR